MDGSCNYDSAAEQDNGSCTYAAEGFDCAGNCLSGDLLTMTDSWGDGWNGAVLTINGVDYTIESGASATACVNLKHVIQLHGLQVHMIVKHLGL